MAAIPGWVYIALGVFMIISSKLINKANADSKMSVFFIIGMVFLVIGIGKYILANYLEDRRMKAHARLHGQQAQELAQQPAAKQETAPQQERHPMLVQLAQRQKAAKIQQKINEPYTMSPAQVPQHLSIITCPVCGTKHYSYANFCMRCGSRMQ